MRFWGRAEASVARRLSVAVSTIATRLPNAKIVKEKKKQKKKNKNGGGGTKYIYVLPL